MNELLKKLTVQFGYEGREAEFCDDFAAFMDDHMNAKTRAQWGTPPMAIGQIQFDPQAMANENAQAAGLAAPTQPAQEQPKPEDPPTS